jgi:2-methylisocitrate lyase-like PEP mutase family enzyme
VYPICLWEASAVRNFMSDVPGHVNISREPQAPSNAELAELGVARVSWGPLLQWDAMARFQEELASIRS